MATVNYDLNSSIDFPPLAKRYAKRLYKRNRRREENDNCDTRSRIDDLNDTLLELIFIKLSPWKYLVTSKCVSKRWNSIISNPYFLRSLTHEHYPFTLLLRGVHYTGRSGLCLISEHPHFRKNKLHLDFIPSGFDHYYSKRQNNRIVDIVAQNNDVVVSCRAFRYSKDLIEYCIANPLTKQYVVVPLPITNPVYYNDYHRVGIAGVVDGVSSVVNTVSNNNRGFRIVRVINEQPTLEIHIYSSETRQWTTYSFNNYPRSYIRTTGFLLAVTLNNKVHWLTSSNKILVIDPFDIDIVPPYTLALPNEFNYYDGILDICQNRLRVALLQEKQALKVWDVEDYNDDNNDELARVAKLRLVIDFPLKRSIIERELSPIDRLFSKEHSRFYKVDKVLGCHPNDPNVVYFVYQKILYSYDAFTQRCKVVSHCTSDWSERLIFVHPLMVS